MFINSVKYLKHDCIINLIKKCNKNVSNGKSDTCCLFIYF